MMPETEVGSVEVDVTLTLNGEPVERRVEARTTLAELLRETLGRTDVVAACEHGVCGSCNVLVDGIAARSCLLLAAQVSGHAIDTADGLASRPVSAALHDAFDQHAPADCRACLPGIVVTAVGLLDDEPQPSLGTIRRTLAANQCRCTGYGPIIDAVAATAGVDLQRAEGEVAR